MSDTIILKHPEEIRAMRAEHSNLRERDFADKFGLTEAQLLAAHVGHGVTRIAATPPEIIGAAQALGTVMALTRTPSVVHEKIGVYEDFHSGEHASMVLGADIDLRIFPRHWQHGFLLDHETENGHRRALQVFDAAGDAVHKIFLRDDSELQNWDRVKSDLTLSEQTQTLSVEARTPAETPKGDVEKVETLRKEWSRMTDTHQFMRLTSKLKMNRLGAYRIVGEPFVRALSPAAIDAMLHGVQQREIGVMVFVGNRGCIQIHSGPIHTVKPMGPWQNVLDPDFNLHLRTDHIAEVWAVEKPTKRGMAVSVEAFDKDGGLIFQTFGLGKEGCDHRPQWKELVDSLPGSEAV